LTKFLEAFVIHLPKNPRKIWLVSAALAVLLTPAVFWVEHRPSANAETLLVAQTYFKANHARDFGAAYHHISSADQLIANRVDYLQAQRSFSGFALELAKFVAAQTKFRLVEQETNGDRARLTLDYKVPATDEISSLLFNWDQKRLNVLSDAERQPILDALEKMTKARNPITIEGRETFNLINEDGQWKIFLDWASRIPVSFDAALPGDSAVEVEVLKRKLFAGSDEPFQTELKIRNRGEREVIARVEHRIEPKEYARHIAMIACGFLSPMTLQPGEEREVSSAYLLDPGLPKSTAFGITLEFHLADGSRAGSVANKTSGGGR
jgi:hypothetical protein